MFYELAGEALRFPPQPSMILVHPPVAKPCEPPAGIAKLLGALNSHGARCKILDANLESLLNILHGPHTSTDAWTHRASRNLSVHLASLRSWPVYGHLARYKRAVLDLDHLLEDGREFQRITFKPGQLPRSGAFSDSVRGPYPGSGEARGKSLLSLF